MSAQLQPIETVGGLIDELFLLREQRRNLAETDKTLRDQYAELEARLIAALDLQETTQARGRSATATLNEEELATVVDWSQVHDSIRSQNAFHLLQRRINSAAWREAAAERGEPIPGTTVFTRRSIRPSPYLDRRLPMPAAATTQRQAIAEYREALRQELASLHTRIAPPASNRISLKGRVFTMPDGSIHAGPIGAVILDFRNLNSYWDTPYNPNQLTDPVCFALSREFGDLAPSADAPTPQAEHCAVCPRNIFGSAPNGKAKSCKNTRRLAIVPPDATLETAPMLLDASPTAISAFESYVLELATEGKMPVEVITHIAFDPASDFPSLRFGKPKPLNDRQLAVMMGLRAKAQLALDMTGARAANEEAGR